MAFNSTVSKSMAPTISFRISAPEPHRHLFVVEMTLQALSEERILLKMPVWTPGSYLIREYARHVQNLEVCDENGGLRKARKIDKSSWEVDAKGASELRVTYEVYAHDLTVRTNHLDGSHGFFNAVATCLYPEGRLHEPLSLEVVAPPGWEVFCGLQALDGETSGTVRFLCNDFDELFDTPVEMGPHEHFSFEVEGIEHQVVFWGEHTFDLEALARDIPELVRANARMFGEIPYERYVFINHMIAGAYGGLEHRHSSVNVFDARGFDRSERESEGEDFGENYANFLKLLCHEHFHAYHVKRLRPEALGPFDYQKENYTRALWAVEGVTSYFDTYNLMEVGLVTPGHYIERLEKRIQQLYRVPGRLLHSLEEAGFDAWIKLYRPDENTRNSSVSYYLKGELVTWLIDLFLRDKSDGEHTMADVLRILWKDYYKDQDIGFPPGAGEKVISELVRADVGPLFETLVRGREEIPWEEYLQPFGLQIVEEYEAHRGWIGLDTKKLGDGRTKISFVYSNSPAEKAGLYAGDDIIAIDRWAVRGKEVAKLVSHITPGEEVRFHVMRRQRLHEIDVTTIASPPKAYKIKALEDLDERQKRLLLQWLGTTSWEK